MACEEVETLGMVLDAGAERVGLEQLIDQAVLRAYLYDIEGDGSGHAHDKGFFRHGDLMAHLVHGGAFAEHLDDGVVVEAIDGAHAADAEYLAAVEAHLSQRALYCHQLDETCHVENIEHLGIDANNLEVAEALDERQQDAEA